MNIEIIAIDAGHNAPRADTGAVGILKEDECINEVMWYLTELLQKLGYKLVLVAPESAITVNESLNARCYKANMANVDLFVSLHFNAFNSRAHGTEIFLANLNKSRPIYEVAERILNNLVKQLGFANRGLKQGNLFVLRNTVAPAMLIEVCFIDNQSDCQKFDARKVAIAIAEGISGSPEKVQDLLEDKQDPMKARLTITDTTVLKPNTKQSSEIPANQLKPLEKGLSCDIELLCDEEKHYEVRFLNSALIGMVGFVYHDHCEMTPCYD